MNGRGKSGTRNSLIEIKPLASKHTAAKMLVLDAKNLIKHDPYYPEDTVIYNLQIEGYDRKEVAYHCKILHSGNLISNYDG